MGEGEIHITQFDHPPASMLSVTYSPESLMKWIKFQYQT